MHPHNSIDTTISCKKNCVSLYQSGLTSIWPIAYRYLSMPLLVACWCLSRLMKHCFLGTWTCLLVSESCHFVCIYIHIYNFLSVTFENNQRSLVYIRGIFFKHCYLTQIIQIRNCHFWHINCFKYKKKLNYFFWTLILTVRMDLRVMVRKGYPRFPKRWL